MSVREALQIQLKTETAERNALEAGNRRLKESRPEQIAVMETEAKLTPDTKAVGGQANGERAARPTHGRVASLDCMTSC